MASNIDDEQLLQLQLQLHLQDEHMQEQQPEQQHQQEQEQQHEQPQQQREEQKQQEQKPEQEQKQQQQEQKQQPQEQQQQSKQYYEPEPDTFSKRQEQAYKEFTLDIEKKLQDIDEFMKQCFDLLRSNKKSYCESKYKSLFHQQVLEFRKNRNNEQRKLISENCQVLDLRLRSMEKRMFRSLEIATQLRNIIAESIKNNTPETEQSTSDSVVELMPPPAPKANPELAVEPARPPRSKAKCGGKRKPELPEWYYFERQFRMNLLTFKKSAVTLKLNRRNESYIIPAMLPQDNKVIKFRPRQVSMFVNANPHVHVTP